MVKINSIFEESESVLVDNKESLLIESSIVKELTGRRWKVRIIEGDVQGSSAYYPSELLESNPMIVRRGTQIFKDHLTEGERPERSVDRLVGYFDTDSWYETDGLYAEAVFFESSVEWVKERALVGAIGMSIRASGTTMEENGKTVATSIDEVHSVDIVTRAGAGGALIEMLESSTEAVNNEEKERVMEELKKIVEAQGSQVAELMEAFKKFVTIFEESQKEDEVQAPEMGADEIAEKLIESGLTKVGRKAVADAVKNGADLEEAISAEQSREKAILEESKVETFEESANKQEKPVSMSEMIFG